MTEKKIVKDALPLAETVAKLIFENSFKYYDGGIIDLLLFGSTLKGPAHDIDMLVIHDDPYLNELGLITTYDEKTSRCIPDLNAKGLEKGHDAQVILQCMGSPIFPNELEASCRVLDVLRERPRDYSDTGRYSGTFDLPYFGMVEIKANNFDQLLDVANGLNKRLRAMTVYGKVKELLDKKGLDVKETLDLQAMNVFLLSPKEFCAEERRLAIQQCTDPTFWHTLLTTGKLYDKGTGKFTDPIQEKYPMAIELFKQEGRRIVMENNAKNKIQEMQDAGIDLGAKVEIFLKEGAVWNTGWGDAPTVDPQGYEMPENRSLGENKGISGVGYVAKYDDTTVMLAPTWNKGPVYKAGNYFVHADVIHSFKKL